MSYIGAYATFASRTVQHQPDDPLAVDRQVGRQVRWRIYSCCLSPCGPWNWSTYLGKVYKLLDPSYIACINHPNGGLVGVPTKEEGSHSLKLSYALCPMPPRED